MIKYVCPSCGERLSVPDQAGGRKGVCPTCQAVSQIPLKGFVETGPKLRGTAAGKKAAGGAPAALAGRAEGAGTTGESAGPENIDMPSLSDLPDLSDSAVSSASPAAAAASPAPGAAAAFVERFAAPSKVIPEPDQAAELRAMRRGRQETPRTPEPEARARPITPQRRLPRPIKRILLIVCALAIAAGLYAALYFALHFAMSQLAPR